MTVVGGRTFGLNALFLVLAIIVFVLAAVTEGVSSATPIDLIAVGLALFAGAFLVD